MRKLRRFLVLEPTKRSLVTKAALFLCLAKVSLGILPFRLARRFLNRFAPMRVSASGSPQARSQIGWAVAAAGRVIPGGRACLPQALTAEMLLRAHGFPACLQIGVNRDGDKKFQAHAWVESEGRVIVGSAGLCEYTPLAAFGGQAL